MSDQPAPPFSRLLLVQAFRVAVRVALRTQCHSHDELKSLLNVAIYRELKEAGYSINEMKLVLECSRNTVKNLARTSREFDGWSPPSPIIRKMLERLQQGPATQEEIGRLLPRDQDFDFSGVAIKVLKRNGLIDDLDQDGVRLVQLCSAGAPSHDFETPLYAVERLYETSITVVKRLMAAPQSFSSLLSAAGPQSDAADQLREAVDFLQQQGYIEQVADGASETPRYRVSTSHLRLIPEEPLARLRVGLMDFLEMISLFLEQLALRPDQTLFAQRGWWFKARPESLRRFYRAHRQYVREESEAMEEEARDAVDARSCMMVWASIPLGAGDATGEETSS